MSDSYIQVEPDSSGKKIDARLVAGEYRQVVALGGDGGVAELVAIMNTDPTGTEYGLVVRHVGALPLPAGAATEATLAGVATQATLASRASEATLASRASEATLAAIQTGVAKDATVATLATQATLATRASEATLGAIKDTDGAIVSQKTPAALTVTKLLYNATPGAAEVQLVAAPGVGVKIVVSKLTISAGATPMDAFVHFTAALGAANIVDGGKFGSYGGINDTFVPPFQAKGGNNEALYLNVSVLAPIAVTVHYYTE
jgi:hypothetical protein